MQSISREEAIIKLQSGAVGVIPTDTVYGIVARAGDEQAVTRMYALKNRENKPGTLIAASIEQLEELGIKHRYLSAVKQYWPNPLSIVTPTGPILSYLHQGKYSLAIRIPADKNVQAILEKTGPLATSSANHPGKTPAETVEAAYEYFGEDVDFYLDGGDLSGREASTVIRIIDDAIEVLRQGAVKIDENGRISKS